VPALPYDRACAKQAGKKLGEDLPLHLTLAQSFCFDLQVREALEMEEEKNLGAFGGLIRFLGFMLNGDILCILSVVRANWV
jgi:hypothetical protein